MRWPALVGWIESPQGAGPALRCVCCVAPWLPVEPLLLFGPASLLPGHLSLCPPLHPLLDCNRYQHSLPPLPTSQLPPTALHPLSNPIQQSRTPHCTHTHRHTHTHTLASLHGPPPLTLNFSTDPASKSSTSLLLRFNTSPSFSSAPRFYYHDVHAPLPTLHSHPLPLWIPTSAQD